MCLSRSYQEGSTSVIWISLRTGKYYQLPLSQHVSKSNWRDRNRASQEHKSASVFHLSHSICLQRRQTHAKIIRFPKDVTVKLQTLSFTHTHIPSNFLHISSLLSRSIRSRARSSSTPEKHERSQSPVLASSKKKEPHTFSLAHRNCLDTHRTS